MRAPTLDHQLRKKQGYRTFRELRIGAWLEDLSVNFGLLQPDVVACLRQALVGQQRLTIGSEDDQLARRLADTRISRSSRMTAYERAISPASILDVLLTVLQLAVDTSHSLAAAETFDGAFSYDNQDALSDVYSDWELPGTPKWPRIVSRVSNKWFVVGREWLNELTTMLIHHRQVLDGLSPSPATSLALKDLRDQLSDLSPAGLEARTLIACQGIVLGKTQPELALRVFDPPD